MMGDIKRVLAATVAFYLVFFSSLATADHAWGKYKWSANSLPLLLDLVDNVDSGWDGHLLTASGDWSVSSVLTTTAVPGSTDPVTCSPELGNVQVCNAEYGDTGWLGIAQIYGRGTTITAGVAKLNDTYYNMPFYNTSAWRLMVMCQEVAHTFGLDHQDEIFNNNNLGTCMDYTDDPTGVTRGGLSNEHPNQHDYDQLVTIYAKEQKTGGGGSSDCNPKSPKCNPASAVDIASLIQMEGPAQWGRLVSGHGAQEVYELDFGGGRRVITFVTWTLEHAEHHRH